MKIYYAHPLSLYGTKQEARDVATLNALGFEVLNPNAPEHDAGYKSGGMDYFSGVIAGCQALAFRPFLDGSIPAGIKKEIEMAQSRGFPVIELPCGIERRALSVPATRETLFDTGCR